jgi:esterase/lipase
LDGVVMPRTKSVLSAVFCSLVAFSAIEANAFILTCKRSNGDVENPELTTMIYNDFSGTLTEQGPAAYDPVDTGIADRAVDVGLRAKVTSSRELIALENNDGDEVGKIKLSGNPVDYKATLHKDSQAYACTVDSPELLFQKAITDPEVHKDISLWKSWVANRPKPCGTDVDSRGYFMYNGSAKTAIVIHGFASNPMRMDDISKVMLDAGYNVIVPRLARHFNKDIHDLDNATPEEWLKDVEEVLKIARAFDRQVTLVGYSLGGLLASQLALKFEDAIERMILVAPAWRVSPGASLGSAMGAAFNISLNKFRNLPESCTLNGAYISPHSGRRIENLQREVETSNFGEPYDEDRSAFRRIRVPMLVFTTPGDEAVSSWSVGQICDANQRCKHVEVPGQDHSKILNSLAANVAGTSKRTMGQIIMDFLKSVR